MPFWFWLIAAIVAIYAFHRLFRWMESRGWIYYTRSGNHSTRAGNAMLNIQQLFEPSKKHVIEMKQSQRPQLDVSGDPPSPPRDDHSEEER